MNQESFLNKADKKHLLFLARQSITARLEGKNLPEASNSPSLQKNAASFVSLHKGDRLRGCIGNLEASEPLAVNVMTNALKAAFKDPRFPPLSQREVTKVEIEISVLTPARPIENIEDFIIGEHGIILELGPQGAVFLPQVAPQQDWDRETTLNNLSLKAGLPLQAWREPEASMKVFSAIVFSENQE